MAGLTWLKRNCFAVIYPAFDSNPPDAYAQMARGLGRHGHGQKLSVRAGIYRWFRNLGISIGSSIRENVSTIGGAFCGLFVVSAIICSAVMFLRGDYRDATGPVGIAVRRFGRGVWYRHCLTQPWEVFHGYFADIQRQASGRGAPRGAPGRKRVWLFGLIGKGCLERKTSRGTPWSGCGIRRVLDFIQGRHPESALPSPAGRLLWTRPQRPGLRTASADAMRAGSRRMPTVVLKPHFLGQARAAGDTREIVGDHGDAEFHCGRPPEGNYTRELHADSVSQPIFNRRKEMQVVVIRCRCKALQVRTQRLNDFDR